MLLTIDVGNTNSVLGVFSRRRADRKLAFDDGTRADDRRIWSADEEFVYSGGVGPGRDHGRDHQLGGAASEPDAC